MTPGPGIEPGTHWWKASALATVLTLLPKMILSVMISYTFICKLMVAGANGTNGASVLRQSLVYKQEQENVTIQSQHMVERNAMEPKQL